MIKDGYLCLPISKILQCGKVEEVVLEESEGWLRDMLYNSTKLNLSRHEMSQIIHNIDKSREKKAISNYHKNQKSGVIRRIIDILSVKQSKRLLKLANYQLN